MQYACAAAAFACAISAPCSMSGQTATRLAVGDVTVGRNLQTVAAVTLDGPAPPEGLQITMKSGDPSRLLLSKTPDGAGSASIVIKLFLLPRLHENPEFYVQGLAASGTVTYTASAPGFPVSTGKATLAPSGVVMGGPFGLGKAFPTLEGAESKISVHPAVLDSSLNFVATQMAAGGVPVKVTLTNSNPAVGAIASSTLVIAGGTDGAATQFHVKSPGKTVLAASAPDGFSTPAEPFATVTAHVAARTFLLSDATIGRNLQTFGMVSVIQPAPAGGIPVTLTSNDPGQLLLSTAEAGAGSEAITVTIPAGGTSARFHLQAPGESGTATYTAAAPGFLSRTAQAALVPSAVVIAGPNGGLRGSAPFFLVSISGGAVVPISVYTAALRPDNTIGDLQPLRGGGPPLQVSVTSSNAGVGTMGPPITISAGGNRGVAQFTAVGAGATTVSVAPPPGFASSSDRTSLMVRVSP